MHLFHLFCSYSSCTCSHTCLSRTIIFLFIQIGTIIINGTILRCLLRVKNVHENQPSPPRNHLSRFTHSHMAYFHIGYLVKWNKTKERQKENFFVHGDLPRGVSAEKRSIIGITYINFINVIFPKNMEWHHNKTPRGPKNILCLPS